MSIETEIVVAKRPEAELEVVAKSPLPKSRRIPALDFTKGTLVLLMVLYHWVNYFVGGEWPYYKYLRFLTPSFIFITGFMISNVYLSKYAASDPKLAKRLFTRGLKLLIVFLGLNVGRALLIPLLGTGALAERPLDPSNLFAVFVSGNLPVTGNKLIAFSILVPIAYLLMLSGLLMVPYRRWRYIFHFVCAAFLASIAVLALTGSGSYNLEFIAIGMLGVLTGFVSIDAINEFITRPVLLALAYLGYVIAITYWNVPFLLLAAGTFLSLSGIFLLGTIIGERGRTGREIVRLGQYSLFGYISQIAILQILSVGFRHVHLTLPVLAFSFIAAFALTVMSVEAVHWARAKAAGVDTLYRLIFA